MPRAMPLAASPLRTAPLSLPTAREESSILSALPFLVDQDLQDALANLRHDPNAREARRKSFDRLSDSISGITASSGWRGARADDARAGSWNIDHAMLLSGRVTRLTARVPVGLEIGVHGSRNPTVTDYPMANRLERRAEAALIHAADRARYRIGEGLLDAACALLDQGLLGEAEVFQGSGRNSPERLLLRDAVFASEDLTVEDMVSILISAPYEVARLFGDPVPVWEEDRVIDDRTPLIFVHCAGITDDFDGRREVVLEAVDFGSIDTLLACAQAIRKRHDDRMGDAQEMLAAVRKGLSSPRFARHR